MGTIGRHHHIGKLSVRCKKIKIKIRKHIQGTIFKCCLSQVHFKLCKYLRNKIKLINPPPKKKSIGLAKSLKYLLSYDAKGTILNLWAGPC